MLNDSAYRGRASEALARQAFEALKQRRLRGNIPRIVDVIPSEPNSPEDQRAIDILLKFHTVEQRGIQVRPHEWARRRYLLDCARKGVDPLPCLVVNPRDSLWTVVKRALRLLRSIFRPAKLHAKRLMKYAHDEFNALTELEKRLEIKWWRRRTRRAPDRVKMRFAY